VTGLTGKNWRVVCRIGLSKTQPPLRKSLKPHWRKFWTSYRTRRDRALQLKADPHEYAAPGTYRILVKVIDIFGNDTSQVFEVKVE
jgi:hypothetical protein